MNALRPLVLAVLSCCWTAAVWAVDATEEPLDIPTFDYSELDITIDGRLDESTWDAVPSYNRMVIIEPDTGEQPQHNTHVQFFYTLRGLYVGVMAEQDEETLIARLSSRDQFISRDGISITLDPSGDGLYGYWFGVNLGGTLSDGTVLPERQFSNQWDGPWKGSAVAVEGGWSAEMFIPWSMMTMPASDGEARNIAFYISRSFAHNNERWSWPALPRTKPVFMSALQPIEVKGIRPKQQFTFYPFASSAYDNNASEDFYKAGFDFYWRPSTNLQITSTINPDFGNVESDDVDVNLTSFETFFPEKRPFFLEGQEIFIATPRARGRNGRPLTLVNTRRIGAPPESLDVDGFELEDIEENRPTELAGAAKVTGQNGNLRYGFLGAFEEDTFLEGELNGVPTGLLQEGRTFGLGRLLYEDTTGGGRRAFGWLGTNVKRPQGNATTHGIDGHFSTATGDFKTDAQVMFSDVDDETGAGGFIDFTLTPERGREHRISFDYFDDSIDINDFGFLNRNDLVGGRYRYNHTNNDHDFFRTVVTGFGTTQQFNTDGKLVRSGLFSFREMELKNNDFIFAEFNYFPKRWDDRNSNDNGDFRIDGRIQTGMFWRTNQARKLSFGFGLFYEQEQLGGQSVFHEIGFTWRPMDRFSLEVEANFETKDGWLLHEDGVDFTTFEAEFWRPEIEADFFLSARQQFRMTLQWNGLKAFEQERWQVPGGGGDLFRVPRAPGSEDRNFSISRMTFQARYRWELAPLSDLFIVYTRGSDVDSDPEADFADLLSAAWTDRQIDVLVVKLRYRLGS